ncbi:MAG: RNA methyltransferase [Bacteroidales bacterium]|nr:RNA methyltransferase [Bacteroidales bacterium]
MISKSRLKELAAYRLQKNCDEEAVFVVEGPKMATEAMAAGMPIRVVCATGEWRAENDERKVVCGEFYEVSQAELERLSNFKTPNQVWMLLDRPDHSSLITHHSSLTLALDRIQDPGNMGTLMRTADWFGVRHIVCSRDTVSCYNPKVVQASMGAIFRTRVDYVDLPAWLAACDMPVYGASLQGEPLETHSLQPTTPKVLLIGNESRGISPEAMATVTHPVLIPNLGGTAESLNAAVAAGILIYYLGSTGSAEECQGVQDNTRKDHKDDSKF